MPNNEVILRFNNVSFEYGKKKILDEATFSVRRGAKLTLMGQNGAGKSTMFQMITGNLTVEEGDIIIEKDLTMGIAKQVIPRAQMDWTVLEFFEDAFAPKKIYDIEPRIKKVLDVVNLSAPLDRALKTFSGGQQARLLLAQAIITDPDVLLLDEPTNNLDKEGIAHLTQFIIDSPKTCIVISHDAEFLNSFTQGVIYLDVFTHKIEQYVGNYLDVVEEIKARLERERMKSARIEKDIQHRKDQANFFAQKGGHMRDVARKMWEKIDELQEEIPDARQEDRTIRSFAIPCQEDLSGRILELTSVSVVKNHKATAKKINITLKKNERLHLIGPNGIGKTTLLEALATGKAKGETLEPGIRIGYYRQDFSTLDFNETVWDTLARAMREGDHERLRSCAAGFLIDAELLKQKVGALSEGQKGLVAFAKLSLEAPGLLILDEPTNHINFRHIPVIAQALDRYQGAMILVSHVPDFVKQIKIDYTLDLGAL
ncbi:MAG: ABC-F family ATP-binding cassette domain-containing protein [Candidatus Pacebacteria bacterium]|nr:ABC-F family ATP-binding cassette domain-containing protein [Candidatus Paceibacterota bacterium]